jgi:endoglucanase
VIGAKPIHLLSPDDRKKVFVKEDMFVDIGATSDKEVAEIGVRPGDVIVPRADFVPLAGDKAYMAKAFDDRVGVAMLISVLQAFQSEAHPNSLYGVATVMEEVGLRGATTSVRAVDPDVAIILESDIAGDVPGIEAEISDVHLGKGPTLLIYDARMIPNLKLRDLVLDTAAELDIPLQFSAITGGATDGGVIHLHQTGVPSVVIGVPARHIHSDSSIMHRADYDSAVALLVALIARLDQPTVAGLTI